MKMSLRHLVKYSKDRYGRHLGLASSAPGRADFLNTHQDYKGLPVVPVAVKLRTYMLAVSWGGEFYIESLNLREEGEDAVDRFDPANIEYEGGWFGDYFRAVAKVFFEKTGVMPSKGLKVVVFSEVPMGAGLASSAALEVAFTELLSQAFSVPLSESDIAEISYIAEHDELKIPCGRLDQYGSAYGGIIKLVPKPPVKVERLPGKGLLFVIVDSGIRHSTAAIHPNRQREINAGLRQLMEMPDISATLRLKLAPSYDQVVWEDIFEEEILPYLDRLDEASAKRIFFTVKMQKLTELAIDLLNRNIGYAEAEKILGVSVGVSDRLGWKKRKRILGEIMNMQHELLRDYYDVSTPELEEIREAMLDAGAYGVKISGAGLGGALISLVDIKNAQQVLNAGLDAGAKRGWISPPAPGASNHFVR